MDFALAISLKVLEETPLTLVRPCDHQYHDT
jgi:hypothetical protein